MNSLRACLFDFDGTIFQSEIIHQAVVKQVIEEYTNTLIDEDELRAYAGIPYADKFIHMLATRGIDDDKVVEQLVSYATALLKANPERARAFVPGVTDFFQLLKDNNIRMAVVSSALHERLENELTAVDMRHFFEFIVGRDDVSAHKPHPEPYETALHKLGVNAKDTVVFEDSPTGVESAWLAGISVIGLLTTFHAEDLTKTAKLIHDFRGLTINDIETLL